MATLLRQVFNRTMKSAADKANPISKLSKAAEKQISDWIKKNGGTREDALKALEKSLTKIG